MLKGGVPLLKEKIAESLEKSPNIDQRKLSKIANVNESSISRFLNGHDELNFEGVLRIVKYLYSEEEQQIMAWYIPQLKSKNARLALEYCVMNHMWDLVDHLIDLLSVSSNPVDKEWAAMYQYIRSRKANEISSIELLKQVEMFKPKEPDIDVLRSIFKAYIYYDMREIQSLRLHIFGVDHLIEDLKSQFLRDSFKVRLGLILHIIYLSDNELDLARSYCKKIIDQNFFEKPKATAYFNLGVSYTLEDYVKAHKYLQLAADHSSARNSPFQRQVKIAFNFLYSHWGVEREFNDSLDSDEFCLGFIYYLIKKNESAKAQQYLNKIDIVKLSDWNKAFYYYYKGLLTKDTDSYYISVELFLDRSNYYYLQLPLEELRKLGENQRVLHIFSKKRRS